MTVEEKNRMKVGILLLCHDAPAHIAARLDSPFFRHADVKVYLHYDGKRSEADFAALGAALSGRNIQLLTDRIESQWGDYSLVEATQRLMQAALADTGFIPDYLALISGSCLPIHPFASLQEFLRRRRGIDFIEAHDISKGPWVKGGLEEERYRYYFPFNFQTQRRWFDLNVKLERILKVRRKIPDGLKIHFGSQWFCLTRETAAKVIARLAQPDMAVFFRKSWIPDEFAIHSLVAAEQQPALIAGHNLTYYEFDENGLPLVLENGHFEHLLRQPFFFARKIAPDAATLVDQLKDHIGQIEYDLSYFERVGTPTADYQRFIAIAAKLHNVRSRVANNKDRFRGAMDGNRRPYYVLYSTSMHYLQKLLKSARGERRLPIFDMLFDPEKLIPARERASFYGLQASDVYRRDYDPLAFLHELVNADPEHPLTFGLDPAIDIWVRNFIVWDPNATLINCDPSFAHRTLASLHDMTEAHLANQIQQTLNAAAQRTWLPREHFRKVMKEGKHTCRFISLFDIPVETPNPVLHALRNAADKIDATPFFPPEADTTIPAVENVKPS